MLPISTRRSGKLSTQPEQPKLLTDNLLEELRGTTDAAVSDASVKTGHFSPEDDDSDNRRGRAAQRQTLRAIRRGFFWVLFVLVSAFAAFAVIGFAIVIAHWVNGFWNNPAKVEAFVYGVGWTVMVALATLFIERSVPEKD